MSTSIWCGFLRGALWQPRFLLKVHPRFCPTPAHSPTFCMRRASEMHLQSLPSKHTVGAPSSSSSARSVIPSFPLLGKLQTLASTTLRRTFTSLFPLLHANPALPQQQVPRQGACRRSRHPRSPAMPPRRPPSRCRRRTAPFRF